MGTIILPGFLLISQLLTMGHVAFMFGWAKPVPVRFGNLRNVRAGMRWMDEGAPQLGAALAFHLLLGVSITTGVVLTAFDTLIVLALQGLKRGYLGDEVLSYAAGQGLVVSLPMHFRCDTVVPGADQPMLALQVRVDIETVRELAPRDLRYLGLIGSRAKVARIYEALTAEGTPGELLARIHAPIGLDIGSVSPAEIAVSVLGEIIMALRKKPLRVEKAA